MASPVNAKKGTNLWFPQGQTAGEYGNDPAIVAKGKVEAPAKPLKP